MKACLGSYVRSYKILNNLEDYQQDRDNFVSILQKNDQDLVDNLEDYLNLLKSLKFHKNLNDLVKIKDPIQLRKILSNGYDSKIAFWYRIIFRLIL